MKTSKKIAYKLIRFTHRMPQRQLMIVLGVLIVSDFVENAHFFYNETCILATRVKLAATFTLLIIMFNIIAKDRFVYLVVIVRTLWYARFSFLTLIFILFYISMPQGKELLVFMIDYENPLLYK